ncbi:MAG: D-alanine--D-alanine ligase [Planctomycetes bacterium]|nr:D-alanine--D-alanine ligase [Planctomycetota bacterium]
MKVIILYNAPAEDASIAESDVLAQRDAVAAALVRLGHDVHPLPATLNLAAVRERLVELQPGVVFNLVESLGGTDRLAPVATLLLDALHLPYTGARTRATLTTSDKLTAKAALVAAGLPTPAWLAIAPDGRQHSQFNLAAATSLSSKIQPASAALPQSDRVILKAVWEHASFHMGDDAIVTLADDTPLDERLRERERTTGRTYFAEAFIDGREFNLTLLGGVEGPEVLPPAEIDFAAFPEGKPRIVGYSAKWDERSFEYHHTPRQFLASAADEPLLDEMRSLARRCWDVFELTGYARVDFRVDSRGLPWILEVNTNPCLTPDAGFAAAVEYAGIGYDRAIGRILEEALRVQHSSHL